VPQMERPQSTPSTLHATAHDCTKGSAANYVWIDGALWASVGSTVAIQSLLSSCQLPMLLWRRGGGGRRVNHAVFFVQVKGRQLSVKGRQLSNQGPNALLCS
jgi:hypothetical protein